MGLLMTLCSISAFADNNPSCFEAATTQRDMNRCASMDFQQAESELAQVLAQIQKHYQDNPSFLAKLEKSQQHWELQRDLDLDMKYPNVDQPGYYGSVFPLCYAGFKTQLTLQRIAFLKEWLKGSEEGDVC